MVAKIGLDTAENEPLKVRRSQLLQIRVPIRVPITCLARTTSGLSERENPHQVLPVDLWFRPLSRDRAPSSNLSCIRYSRSFSCVTCFHRSDRISPLITCRASCRYSASRLGELAKFLLDIRTTRRRNHRHLKSDGPNGRIRVMLRLVWECWREALAPVHRSP